MIERGNDWCILRTGGPSTVRLASSLQAAGIAPWTPIEQVRRRVPRKKAVEHRSAPLAPTYVFVQASHLQQLRRIERADVSPHPRFSIFRYYGETVFVRHAELHPLRQLQQDSYLAALPSSGRTPGKPRGVAYAIGDPVTFKEGPLAGLKCFVEVSDGLTTSLALTLFGRMSTVKVQTRQLRSSAASELESTA